MLLQKMMRLRKDHLGTGEGEPAPLKLRGPKVIRYTLLCLYVCVCLSV